MIKVTIVRQHEVPDEPPFILTVRQDYVSRHGRSSYMLSNFWLHEHELEQFKREVALLEVK